MTQLEEIEQKLASNPNYGSLTDIYKTLEFFIYVNPGNSGEVNNELDVFEKALSSDKNDRYSLYQAYESLENSLAWIIEANSKNPEVVNKVWNLFEKALSSDKNDGFSLSFAYKSLARISRKNPGLVNKALDVLEKGLSSDKNDSDSLGSAYSALSNIIKENSENPEVVNKAWNLFEKALSSDRKCGAYGSLAWIIEANSENPEVVKKAFDVFEKNLSSDKNDGFSLDRAYMHLGSIIRTNPENSEVVNKAFDLFEKGLSADKNESFTSLDSAYFTLSNIIKENSENPEVVSRAWNLFEKALSSDKNDSYSLSFADFCLTDNSDNIKANPEVLDNIEDPMSVYMYSKIVQEEGLSFEERKKLIEAMNESAAKAPKEGDLKNLKGTSLYQSGDYTVKGSFIHKAADLLASQGNISVLYEAMTLAPNTPASQPIKAACEEHFDQRSVDFIAEHYDEIKKVPYKHMIFGLAPNSKNETTIVTQSSNYKEANFLDAFTEKLKDIAKKKYGQTDDFYCLSNAAKNPEFLEDADKLWNKMFEKVEETPLYPNWHDNAFVRKMFPEKAEELHQHTSEHYTSDMEKMIDYLGHVGKMSKAIKEYCTDHDVSLNGNLHFDLVNAGVDNFKDAKRCLDIWCAANERPDAYGSPYNNYEIKDIVPIAKTPVKEAWMYPVMMNAVCRGGLSISDRVPSERTLFDACKAWKICPAMPQRLAEKVGKHSLYGRMLAGAIFEQMTEKGQTSSQEWKDNKHLHEQFFKELSTAEKMNKVKALQHYGPDNTVNRKRLAGAILEESGKEPTKENFVGLYRDMRNHDAFSTMLAQNTPNTPRLRVEIARKNAEAEAEEVSHDYKKSLLETKKKLYRKQVKTTSPVKKVEVKKSEKPVQQSSLDANIKPVKEKDQR
jgi:hypothetical protein